VFAGVFALYGCLPLIHSATPRWWSFAATIALATIAFIRPEMLRPYNRAWLMFGRLLHRIVSPLVMGVIFFLCVTPIAYIMRFRGKDVLLLKRRPDLTSYWIPRGLSAPTSESMKRQF
jgi:hypothetical protein